MARSKLLYAVNLVPAYGRDYKSPEAVLKDWTGNKDFRIADVGNPWDGKYTGKGDWHGQSVRIRFNRLADFVIIHDAEIVGSSNE